MEMMKGYDIMLKIRLEYADNEVGLKELERAMKSLEKNFIILNKSKAYSNRNNSYKRIYLNVENKGTDID